MGLDNSSLPVFPPVFVTTIFSVGFYLETDSGSAFVSVMPFVAYVFLLDKKLSRESLQYPKAPCMEYEPTRTYMHHKCNPNVGRYSKHGAYEFI